MPMNSLIFDISAKSGCCNWGALWARAAGGGAWVPAGATADMFFYVPTFYKSPKATCTPVPSGYSAPALQDPGQGVCTYLRSLLRSRKISPLRGCPWSAWQCELVRQWPPPPVIRRFQLSVIWARLPSDPVLGTLLHREPVATKLLRPDPLVSFLISTFFGLSLGAGGGSKTPESWPASAASPAASRALWTD